MRLRPGLILSTTAAMLTAGLIPAISQTPKPFDPVAPGRETEAVVLTGANFAGWSGPDEVTAKVPTTEGAQCYGSFNEDACTHNRYEKPEVATGDATAVGVPVEKLLGYRWNGQTDRWEQIPFQVDELATRYLSNHASGFAFYSETDQNLTYVFDQERFNWTAEDPADRCHAIPRDGHATSPDPVPGLDNNDELVFMASDAGEQAPVDAPLPAGVADSRQVVVTDPLTGTQSFAYVMLAGDGADAATPEYTADNGYVRYLPDADSDTFLFSESSYEDYGNTFKGAWFDEATNTCVTNSPKQHRPKDTAWVKTPRYEFRYDGRWRLTETRVASEEQDAANAAGADPADWAYGPDLVDQWKARAFQQRPGGETPCCGYEEEDNNWGGSSILMGYRAGPVRVIRSTWGADSSTNIIRSEIFYRDEMHQQNNLRVHVIPPGDGIYAQWDFNAGKVGTYYNPFVPDGVKVDGKNDEVFGNGRVHEGTDGLGYQADDKTGVDPVDEQVNNGITVGSPGAHCPDNQIDGNTCINNDVDTVDPTFSGPVPTWEQIGGVNGTFVDRTFVRQVTAGAGYSLVTTPYYRDDSCFDDGTGADPGLHMRPKNTDLNVDANGNPRVCWQESDGDPSAYSPVDHFYQGDIGTHGLHILVIAESDNATATVPVDEISSDFRRVILPGDPGNVGELYGRGAEKPLVAAVTVEHRAPIA
jgi:hypothetical protein